MNLFDFKQKKGKFCNPQLFLVQLSFAPKIPIGIVPSHCLVLKLTLSVLGKIASKTLHIHSFRSSFPQDVLVSSIHKVLEVAKKEIVLTIQK